MFSLSNENVFTEELKTLEDAKKAYSYFASRVSTLAPCGEFEVTYLQVGKQWLILETVSSNNTDRLSWRLWQLNSINGGVINLTRSNWELIASECT